MAPGAQDARHAEAGDAAPRACVFCIPVVTARAERYMTNRPMTS